MYLNQIHQRDITCHETGTGGISNYRTYAKTASTRLK
jgi:hypothetical protein